MYTVTIEQFENDKREKCIVDLRTTEKYERKTLEGAIHIYWEDLEQHINELPMDKPVYFLCNTGIKSAQVAADMRERGYDAYSIAQGYHAYLRLEAQKQCTVTAKDVERSIVKRFRKEIWRPFVKAINEYDMIQDGDRIAVCISGGKDSMLLAKLFQELERHGKKNFECEYLVMNPGYNDINYQTIVNNAKLLDVPIKVFDSDIFDTVAKDDIGGSPCYLCARMRRGFLYAHAKELGCNKIALGHHFDDVIETIVMGMLYGAQIQTMMPKLHSTNFEGMELIRPMYLIREDDIEHFRDYNHLYFIQCACRFTESYESDGEVEQTSKRKEVKELIRQLAQKDPVIEKNIFKSVENVNLNTVIAYKDEDGKHHFLDDY
ncbi:MAG: ATP-binding protein [Lachnospiraceae bacterium]